MNSRPSIYFVCGLPRSGTTAAIRGIRVFPNVYAIPYELAVPEILYRLNYSIRNRSFQPAFNEWLNRHYDQVIYRCNSDPDQCPFDSELVRTYKQLLEYFRNVAKESADIEIAAAAAMNFFYQMQKDSGCKILVEKTPSTAIFSEQARLMSRSIQLISCVREPSAFIESCRRRHQSSTEYEKAGFEGGDDAYIKEVVYYFSRIRDLLFAGSSFLIQHECISFAPRSSCGYLYAVLFGQAPDLGTLNKFNDVVGAGNSLHSVDSKINYSFASDLFAELGYPYRQPLECYSSACQSGIQAVQPYYGMIQTPGAWIKINERFHAVLTRGAFSFIELALLCECPASFVNEFVFEAKVNNAPLPVQIQAIGDVCKVRVDLTSLKQGSPALVIFRASSLISSFLSKYCSDDLFYNIITNIQCL